MDAKKYCTSCGGELTEMDALSCPHCGDISSEATTRSGKKNPVLAVILSFFILGLGQLYNGQFGKAVICAFFGYPALVLAYSAKELGNLYGIVLLIWLFSLYDAYNVATRLNSGRIPRDSVMRPHDTGIVLLLLGAGALLGCIVRYALPSLSSFIDPFFLFLCFACVSITLVRFPRTTDYAGLAIIALPAAFLLCRVEFVPTYFLCSIVALVACSIICHLRKGKTIPYPPGLAVILAILAGELVFAGIVSILFPPPFFPDSLQAVPLIITLVLSGLIVTGVRPPLERLQGRMRG
jgi:TM2 domain-containing membrane protein YozV